MTIVKAMICVGCLVFTFSSHAMQKEPIKIGLMAFLSGPNAIIGRASKNCAQMAVDEINQSGGINGRQLALYFGDTGYKTAKAFNAAHNLIEEHSVDVIVGAHNSDSRLAVKDYIESQERLYIYSTYYEGRDSGDYTFFIGDVPNQQLHPAIRYFHDNFQGRKWFIIGNDYSYSRISNAVAKDFIIANGGQIVGEEYYPLGTKNFSYDNIISQNPDFILDNTVTVDSLIWNHFFAPLATQNEIKVLTTGLGDEGLLVIPAHLSAGIYAVGGYFETIPTATNQDFLTRYYEQFDDPIHHISEMAYEAVHLLAAGLKANGGNTDMQTLKNAMIGQEFYGPKGYIKILENHHAMNNIYLINNNVEKGFRIIETFEKIPPNPNL